MIEKMEEVLCRELTDKERSVMQWVLGWERETIDILEGLFAAHFKAGQDDVYALHEAMESGDARD